MFKKSFSLLEITILLFILGLIFIIIGSVCFSYRKTVVIKVQQEKILADLNYAKNTAQAQSRDVDVIFYSQTYIVQSGPEILQNIYLAKDFSTSPQHFGFTGSGSPKYAGTLHLYNKNQPVANLTIAVGSGLMKWQNLH